MVLFTIGVIALIILVVFAVLTISIGGSVFIIVFSDVIVCAAILYWILKHFCGKKKKSERKRRGQRGK